MQDIRIPYEALTGGGVLLQHTSS